MSQDRITRWLLPVLIAVSILLPLNELFLRFEEPRRALVSLEMILSGDYVIPRLHQADYWNKPPLFNWCIVGLAGLFGGLQDWIVRLPSILGLFGMAALMFVWSRRTLGPATAFLASCILLTAGDIYFFETTVSGEMDLFYSLLVLLQAYCIFEGYQQNRFWLLFAGSCFFMTLGILTKGLPSILFQGLTLVGWAVYQRKWRWLFQWTHLAGILLAALILGTYGYAYTKHGDLPFFVLKLFMEASEKSGLESSVWDILLAPLSYPLQLIRFLLPWSLLAPFLVSKFWKRHLRTYPLLAFSLVFIAWNILPYALTSYAKSRYIYMFFPFFALWLSLAWHERKQIWPKLAMIPEYIWGGLLSLLAGGLAIAPFLDPLDKLPAGKMYFLAMALFLGIVSYQFWKQKEARVYWFIAGLVVLRFAFNDIYFPLVAQSESQKIGEASVRLARQTTGDSLFFYAEPDTVRARPAFAKLIHAPAEKMVAPFIYYAIPYYMSLEKQQIIPYRHELQAGKLYIAFGDEVAGVPKTIIDSLYDKHSRQPIVLFQKLP